MKSIAIISSIVFMFFMGCQTAEDANERIEECIEEEYGEEAIDEKMAKLEVSCEDGEDGCDECVDCVLDAECDALLDGECSDQCK